MPSVLFVDDEPRVLQGLRNALRKWRRKWHMDFAPGPHEALVELEQRPYDVIVTDMRMPAMDGASFLERARAKHGDTVRIVLSGYAESEAAMRAVSVAHQFVMKPCPPEALIEVIRRALALEELVADPALRRLVAGMKQLPSVPKVYQELTTALADVNTDAGTVARIVEQDPAMSAKILQLVNSAFFASPVPIATVTQGVMRLGFDTVRDLALSLEIFRAGTIPGVGAAVLERIQRHALLTSVAVKAIVADGAKSHKDQASLAAMVHDVGMLVLFSSKGRIYAKMERETRDEEALVTLEQEAWGLSHAEVGAYLLGLWGLPYPVVDAVAHHHNPARAGDAELPWALCLGSRVAGIVEQRGLPRTSERPKIIAPLLADRPGLSRAADHAWAGMEAFLSRARSR